MPFVCAVQMTVAAEVQEPVRIATSFGVVSLYRIAIRSAALAALALSDSLARRYARGIVGTGPCVVI
jgi:hypothetical protein